MSDHFSDEDLKHLRDLEALRDRGVLSKDEYERAHRRLAAGRALEPRIATEAPIIRPSYASWIILAAAALIVLLLGIWFLSAREPEPATEVANLDNGLVLNEAGTLPGPELCASEAAYDQLRDIVFDRAIEQFQGDDGPLNSLRRAVGVRMQYPMLRDVYTQIQRTDCSGRLILDIPPAAQDEFHGATALQADVEYAIQSSAEGTSNIVGFGGGDILVQRLVAAATLLTTAQAASGDGAQSTAGGWAPLDCEGELSDSESLICGNPVLSRQDRSLSDRYGRLSQSLPARDRPRLIESRRQFLEQRADCADEECLADLYEGEAANLDRLARTSIDIMEL